MTSPSIGGPNTRPPKRGETLPPPNGHVACHHRPYARWAAYRQRRKCVCDAMAARRVLRLSQGFARAARNLLRSKHLGRRSISPRAPCQPQAQHLQRGASKTSPNRPTPDAPPPSEARRGSGAKHRKAGGWAQYPNGGAGRFLQTNATDDQLPSTPLSPKITANQKGTLWNDSTLFYPQRRAATANCHDDRPRRI